MSKVIMFSRQYPAYHPRKGEPTYFVEKILNWYWDQESNNYHNVEDMLLELNFPIKNCFDVLEPVAAVIEWKHHTIRLGNRWKAGDYFSPRVWSGKPYRSKQFFIAPDIEVKKLWDIESTGNNHLYLNEKSINVLGVEILAMNDGLNYQDLIDWLKYPKPFKGQIICWSDSINY